MFNRSLISVEISGDLFNKIRTAFNDNVELKDDLTPFKCGYRDKNKIYLAKSEKELICQAKILMYIDDSYTEQMYEIFGGANNSWKQIVCRCNEELEQPIEKDFTGCNCVIYMNKLLSDYYTKDEIDACLRAHEAEYDENKKQRHNTYYYEVGRLVKYKNCIKYDIHKAHLSALIEIFPKAEHRLLELAEKAKKDKKYKKIANYYVGMLAHKKQGQTEATYRKTYNWIVQRTTALVDELTEELTDIWTSEIVYQNTDSTCVSHPKAVRQDSSKIGEFGIEYTGDVYSYRGTNYTIYQFGDEIKGTLPLSLRKYVDLRVGRVVSYTRKKVDNHYEIQDIKQEQVNEQN